MRARPQLLPLPLQKACEGPQPATPVLHNDLLLGSSAPMRDASSNAADLVYNSTLTTKTNASDLIIHKPANDIIFRNRVINVKQNVDDNDDEPTVRRKSPPCTLKLPPSLSLPHLCTMARTESSMTTNAYFQDTEEQKSISKILDYLYVGDMNDAASAEMIEAHKIRRVINVSNINVCAPQIPRDENHFLRISVHDSGNARLLPLFDDTYKFIEAGRCEKDNVLVHCMAGISRSPTVAIAYIMRSQRIGYEEARKIVKCKRPCISPNINFMGQLVAYEWALRLQNILPPLIEWQPHPGMPEKKNIENVTERDIMGLSSSTTEKVVAPTEVTTTCQILPPSRRPTCLKGLNMRSSSSYINKSYSSDFIVTALRSTTSTSSSSTTSFSSSSSSTTSSSTYSLSTHSTMPSILHNLMTMQSSSSSPLSSNTTTTLIKDNGNRMTGLCHIRQQRPASMPSMVIIDNPSSSSQEYTTIPTAVADLLNIKYKHDSISSPSTEFSKLDISLMNPCFALKSDAINTRKLNSCDGGCRFSTNTDISTSSGVFTETSYEDQEDDRSSIGVSEDETRVSEHNSKMFVNPMFELTNKYCEINMPIDLSEITKTEAAVNKIDMNGLNKSKDSITSDQTHLTKSFLQSSIRKNHISNNYNKKFTVNFAESRGKFNCYCCLNDYANTKKIALASAPFPCASVNRLRTILTHCRARPMCLSRPSYLLHPSRLPPLEDNEDVIDDMKQLSPPTSTSAGLTISEYDHVRLNSIDATTTGDGYNDKGYDSGSLQRINIIRQTSRNKSNGKKNNNLLSDGHFLTDNNIDELEDVHPTKKKRRIKKIKLQLIHNEEMDIHISTDNINSSMSYPIPTASNSIECNAKFKETQDSTLFSDLTKIHSAKKTKSSELSRSTMTTIAINATKTRLNVKRRSSMSKQDRKHSTKALINENTTASDTELDIVRCDPDIASVGSASSQEIFANYCYVI